MQEIKPNQRFFRLKTIEQSFAYGKSRKIKCQCDCGKVTVVWTHNLRSGHSRSCGCYNKEVLSARSKVQAFLKPKTYATWKCMKKRCLKKDAPEFARYGGSGITVCKRWLSFENFLNDMGERPDGHTLDRINNNKGYYKSNCRWATLKEQARNKRKNIYLEYKDQKKLLVEWAEIKGLSISSLRARLRKGWSINQALEVPPFRHRNFQANASLKR